MPSRDGKHSKSDHSNTAPTTRPMIAKALPAHLCPAPRDEAELIWTVPPSAPATAAAAVAVTVLVVNGLLVDVGLLTVADGTASNPLASLGAAPD